MSKMPPIPAICSAKASLFAHEVPCLYPGSTHSTRHAFTLLELLVVLAILALVVGIVCSAILKMRAASVRLQCTNNMRQHGIALHHYSQVHSRFPPGVTIQGSKSPTLYMSWMTQILPFLGESERWKRAVEAYRVQRLFLISPPHSETYEVALFYSCPLDPRSRQTVRDNGTRHPGLTSYLGVNGTRSFFRDGVLFDDSQVRTSEITDGLSQTLLVGERPSSADLRLGWWYAGSGQLGDGEGDSVLGTRTKNAHSGSEACPIGPYPYGPGVLTNQCDAFHFWSLHSGGAHFLYCDGSVRFLAYSANDILPALGTRAGGEPVSPID